MIKFSLQKKVNTMFKFSIIIASIIIFIACSKPKDNTKERATYQKQLADKAYKNLNKELE